MNMRILYVLKHKSGQYLQNKVQDRLNKNLGDFETARIYTRKSFAESTLNYLDCPGEFEISECTVFENKRLADIPLR